MAFRSKGRAPESVASEEKQKATEAGQYEPDAISSLLGMENVAKALAHNYPDSPNCDAVKSALSNAAHGIAHVRKVLAQNARLA